MRENEKILAINLLVDLLMSFVLHVIWIFGRNTVDNDFLIELDSQSILVDGNFLDVVSASNLHSSLSDEVLNDDIGH
jgi:hypothetical protein